MYNSTDQPCIDSFTISFLFNQFQHSICYLWKQELKASQAQKKQLVGQTVFIQEFIPIFKPNQAPWEQNLRTPEHIKFLWTSQSMLHLQVLQCNYSPTSWAVKRYGSAFFFNFKKHLLNQIFVCFIPETQENFAVRAELTTCTYVDKCHVTTTVPLNWNLANIFIIQYSLFIMKYW